MKFFRKFLSLATVALFFLQGCSEEKNSSLNDALADLESVVYHEKDAQMVDSILLYYDSVYRRDTFVVDSILSYRDSVYTSVIDSINEHAKQSELVSDSIQNHRDSMYSFAMDSIRAHVVQNELALDSLLSVLSEAQETIDSLMANEIERSDGMFSWMDSIPALNVTEPHKVACLGNSITIHEPYGEIGWNSKQGMAASKLELDYVHQMDYLLKKYNSSSEAVAVSIKGWEKAFTPSLDSVIENHFDGVDVIVVRIGENMPNDGDSLVIEAAFDSLFAYSKRHADYVITSGLYWPDAIKERACIRAAQRHGIRYVDISWIYSTYGEHVRLQQGDTLYDVNENAYVADSDFIFCHPNDFGMRLIADEIFKRMISPAQTAE